MAIALVQSQESDGTNAAFTLTTTPTTGDLIVLVVALNGTGYGTAPTGAGVTSWTTLENNSSGAYAAIFYGTVGASPTTALSWTNPGSVFNDFSAVMEFSGVGSLDQSSTGSHGSSTSAAGPSFTPGAADELFVNAVAGGNGGGFQASSGTSGWTLMSTSAFGGDAAYLIATDSLAHGCTFTALTSGGWQTVGACWAPAGAGGGPTLPDLAMAPMRGY